MELDTFKNVLDMLRESELICIYRVSILCAGDSHKGFNIY